MQTKGKISFRSFGSFLFDNNEAYDSNENLWVAGLVGGTESMGGEIIRNVSD